jgi:hypothetical protein
LKEGKIGPVKRKFLIFFFLSTFCFPLSNSVTNSVTVPRLKNIGRGGGEFAPLTPPSYAYGFNYIYKHKHKQKLLQKFSSPLKDKMLKSQTRLFLAVSLWDQYRSHAVNLCVQTCKNICLATEHACSCPSQSSRDNCRLHHAAQRGIPQQNQHSIEPNACSAPDNLQ